MIDFLLSLDVRDGRTPRHGVKPVSSFLHVHTPERLAYVRAVGVSRSVSPIDPICPCSQLLVSSVAHDWSTHGSID